MRSSLERRFSSSEGAYTNSQIQMDAAVGTLAAEASNPATLGAIVIGSFGYKASNLLLTRIASPLLSESAAITRMLAQGFIRGSSLAAEVTLFRGASNGFGALAGHASPQGVLDSKAWFATYMDFLSLKTFGRFGRQNIAAAHFAQANAMVIGHNLTASLGLTEKQHGSYIEQLAHAEILNLQLGLGMSLLGRLAPGISVLERRMEMENGIQRATLRSQPPSDTLLALHSQTSSGSELELPFTPTRMDVPPTHNFTGLSLSLHDRASYVAAERRALVHGLNFETGTVIPMFGSREYAPDGAGPTERMRVDPLRGLEVYTGKWDLGSVITMSTAILGLGEAVRLPYDVSRIVAGLQHLNAETSAIRARKIDTIAAAMGQVVMYGKVKWLRDPAGVSAFPLSYTHYFTDSEVRELLELPDNQVVEKMREMRSMGFARFVEAFAPNSGAINLEDLSLKELRYVLPYLEPRLEGKNFLWDDDAFGTGETFAGFTESWLKHSRIRHPNRNWDNILVLIEGGGAGGYGVYKEQINHGARPENIIVTDTQGVLWEGRPDIQNDPFKVLMSQGTRRMSVEEARKGVHLFFNLADPKIFTKDPQATEQIIRELAEDAAIVAGTNPEPGLYPEQVALWRPDVYYGSGNQRYENCANNFLAFPHMIGAALMARAGGLRDLMTRQGAIAISRLAENGPDASRAQRLPRNQQEFGRHFLLPHPRDLRMLSEMAAIAKAAARSGVVIPHALPEGIHLSSTPTPEELIHFDRYVDNEVRIRRDEVEFYRERVARDAPRRLQIRFGRKHAPFRLPDAMENEWEVPPPVILNELSWYADHLGISREAWRHLLLPDGELKPEALTTALTHVKDGALGDHEHSRAAQKELALITDITQLCPSLGMALALQRSHLNPSTATSYETIFHNPGTMQLIRRITPDAIEDIYKAFPTVPRIAAE